MRIAVLGAGYAGLALARSLEQRLAPDDDLVVVDERSSHLVQHRLHRVIRKPSIAEDLEVPLSTVLARASHRQASVESVDADAGTVSLDDGELAYDLGAVAIGARTDFHGLEGVAEHGTPLKRLDHAERIRADALSLIDGGGGRVVVGGAGLSGVQVAGELVALADERDAGDTVDVHLIEQADRVAPTFPDEFRRAVDAELRDRGVVVETHRAVERATGDRIVLSDGTEMAYDQFVWTGGITGQAAMGGARPTVRARLRLGRRTFGLGDAVTVVDADGTAVPASAQTALAQADVAATNLGRLADHRRHGRRGFEPPLATYRYDPRGWVVTVGEGTVATVGPTVLTGAPARAVKRGIGARYRRSLGQEWDLGSLSPLRGD
jgi:NADH dehydrogenase